MSNKPVIIFDFDGTIADTMDVLIDIYNEAAPRLRCKPLDRGDLPALRNQASIRDLLHDHGIRFWKMPFLFHAIRRGFAARATAVHPHAGVKELLQELHREGVVVGIVSSNSVENIQAFLVRNGMEGLVAFIRSSDRLLGKHTALTRIIRERKCAHDQVWYAGDDLRDVDAAKRAGVNSIAVSWGFQARSALLTGSPGLIVDVPSEILSHLRGRLLTDSVSV